MFFEGRVFCFKLCDQGVLIGQTAFLFDCNIKTCIFFLFSHLVDVKQKKETRGKKEKLLGVQFSLSTWQKNVMTKKAKKKQAHRYSHICSGKSTSIFFKGFFCLSVKNEICIFLFLRAEKNAPGLYCGLSTKGENTTFFSKASRSFSLKP